MDKLRGLFSTDRRKLFLASFLSLFLELALIRWVPGRVHVVSFFNNLVLIACFLGLGIGMALPADTNRVRALGALAPCHHTRHIHRN